MQNTWVRSLGQQESPGGKNGYPFQYSCLENPMDGGAWRAIPHGIAESDMTEQLTHPYILLQPLDFNEDEGVRILDS